MIQKFFYLIVAISGGWLFYSLNIPAGWLLGSIVTGMFFGTLIRKYTFSRLSFKIALAFVGSNISLLLSLTIIKSIRHLILPLLLTIVITIIISMFFGVILYKKSKFLDKTTAFFCCIPGGASEIIGISGQYGADDRMVAAFHSVRIIFFVISIPLIVSYLHPLDDLNVLEEVTAFNLSSILFIMIVITITLLLDFKFQIPGGTLLFSILIGFFLNQFVVEIDKFPRFIVGIGQASIGAFVGIRFDKEVIGKIWQAGPITVVIMLMFFLMSLGNAFLFYMITKTPFETSLISTVPAGAAEMSVTAVALDINPTIVASLHIIRVILLFLSLPFLIKFFKYLYKNV